MPNTWVKSDYPEFKQHFPNENECPWNDIGCHKYLESTGFPYGCTLYGVYRDNKNTDVVTTYASEGDLYAWSTGNLDVLLPEREALVRPVAIQLFDSVRQLHDLSIVHRDVSMENVLLSKPEGGKSNGALELRLIDFGMASTQRTFPNCVLGKEAYLAPELHDAAGQYDAFLSDAFAAGVTLYCILTNDYPWLSTKPGQCKCFDYMKKHGFRRYSKTRKLRGSGNSLADAISEPLLHTLDGLLSLDPAKRLTLGEAAWRAEGGEAKESVWDLEWLRGCGTPAPPLLVLGTLDEAVPADVFGHPVMGG
jgi:serine/threonine-protein kinase Chk2